MKNLTLEIVIMFLYNIIRRNGVKVKDRIVNHTVNHINTNTNTE